MSTFKISLPGVDVKSANITEQVINSLYASPKVNTLGSPPHAGIIRLNWSSSNIVIPPGTTRLLYSFPHNYGYIPTVFGTHNFDNGSTRIKGMIPFNYGALGLIVLDADETYVNLKWLSTDFSAVTPVTPFLMQIRFYVFAERGFS